MKTPIRDYEEQYAFTFGQGQKYEGKYVVISGDLLESRNKMVERFGLTWSAQYMYNEHFLEIAEKYNWQELDDINSYNL